MTSVFGVLCFRVYLHLLCIASNTGFEEINLLIGLLPVAAAAFADRFRDILMGLYCLVASALLTRVRSVSGVCRCCCDAVVLKVWCEVLFLCLPSAVIMMSCSCAKLLC